MFEVSEEVAEVLKNLSAQVGNQALQLAVANARVAQLERELAAARAGSADSEDGTEPDGE